MNVVISPKRVTQILTSVILCLTLASLAGLFLAYYLSHPWFLSIYDLFGLNREANIPTWYAWSTLLLSAFLLAIIAFAKKKEGARFVLHWTALSFIFLYLSFDEAFMVHESWDIPSRLRPYFGGHVKHEWVIIAMAFLLIFILAYLRFIFDLPVKTRRLFIIAGAIFVGGAAGMEVVAGYYRSYSGWYNITYPMIQTVEEFLEMLGIVVFIYALMSYMSFNDMRFRFDREPVDPVERS